MIHGVIAHKTVDLIDFQTAVDFSPVACLLIDRCRAAIHSESFSKKQLDQADFYRIIRLSLKAGRGAIVPSSPS